MDNSSVTVLKSCFVHKVTDPSFWHDICILKQIAKVVIHGKSFLSFCLFLFHQNQCDTWRLICGKVKKQNRHVWWLISKLVVLLFSLGSSFRTPCLLHTTSCNSSHNSFHSSELNHRGAQWNSFPKSPAMLIPSEKAFILEFCATSVLDSLLLFSLYLWSNLLLFGCPGIYS